MSNFWHFGTRYDHARHRSIEFLHNRDGHIPVLKIAFAQAGLFEQMAEKAQFEVAVAVHRHRQNCVATWMGVDAVTATNPSQLPTLPLQNLAQVLPRDGLQNSISTSWSCELGA